MQANTERRLVGLKDKIPDIQKTLDTVRYLKTRKVSYSKVGGHQACGEADNLKARF